MATKKTEEQKTIEALQKELAKVKKKAERDSANAGKIVALASEAVHAMTNGAKGSELIPAGIRKTVLSKTNQISALAEKVRA